MKTTRHLSTDNLRQLCIDNGYYTRGTNDEYYKLFERFTYSDDITDKKLDEITTDIFNHSNITKFMNMYNTNDKIEIYNLIAFNIINACVTFID